MAQLATWHLSYEKQQLLTPATPLRAERHALARPTKNKASSCTDTSSPAPAHRSLP